MKRLVSLVLVIVMLVSTMAVVASAATATVSMSVLASQAVTSDGKVWYEKYNTYGSQSKHTEATTTLTFNPNDGYIPMAFVKSAGWSSLLDKQYTEAVNKYGYEVAGVINGSYFDMSSATLCGNLIVDGKVSCAHVDYIDSFVAFDSDGNMDIVQSCLEFTLRFNGQEIPDGLAYLNKRQDVCGDWGNNRFFYYDTSCGPTADSSSQGYDIICEKVDNSELAVGQTLFGKVVEIKTNTYGSSFGTSGQLSNRFVLSVKNGSEYAAYAQNLKVGDTVSITTTETVEASREIMEKANSVITNVGWLVKGGVDQTNIYSTIGSHSVTGTYARWTAFGKKADGTYVFFTSEGGSTGVSSRSLTLKDVAAAMIKLGCTDVIRMDGGGSSAMYVSNTGSGSPGYVQSSTRPVADCILIVKKSSLVDDSLNSQLRTAINNAKANNPTAEVSAIIAEAEACLAETYPVSGDVKRYLMELSTHEEHSFGAEADCENDQVCTICGYVNQKAYGHQENRYVTPPTCTEDGYTLFVCVDCGNERIGDIVPASHSFETITVAPTCTTEGYTARVCEDCGYEDVINVIPASHSYRSTVTAPTCSSEGYTTHTCVYCGNSYADTYVRPTGHTYVSVDVKPTCTEQGYTGYVCEICGDVDMISYTDDALGHTEGEWVTLPDGNQELRCEVCDELLDCIITIYDAYDVNHDGVIDVFDYYVIKSIVMCTVYDEVLSNRCDVNGDGKLNIFDYVAVKSKYFKS